MKTQTISDGRQKTLFRKEANRKVWSALPPGVRAAVVGQLAELLHRHLRRRAKTVRGGQDDE